MGADVRRQGAVETRSAPAEISAPCFTSCGSCQLQARFNLIPNHTVDFDVAFSTVWCDSACLWIFLSVLQVAIDIFSNERTTVSSETFTEVVGGGR
jgi:hypothetical protein